MADNADDPFEKLKELFYAGATSFIGYFDLLIIILAVIFFAIIGLLTIL